MAMDLFAELPKFFQLPRQLYVLYYSGHGNSGNGSWVIREREAGRQIPMTPEMVLTTWEATTKDSKPRSGYFRLP